MLLLAKLGSGSIHLAQPLNEETDRALKRADRMFEALDKSKGRDFFRNTLATQLSKTRERLEASHSSHGSRPGSLGAPGSGGLEGSLVETDPDGDGNDGDGEPPLLPGQLEHEEGNGVGEGGAGEGGSAEAGELQRHQSWHGAKLHSVEEEELDGEGESARWGGGGGGGVKESDENEETVELSSHPTPPFPSTDINATRNPQLVPQYKWGHGGGGRFMEGERVEAQYLNRPKKGKPRFVSKKEQELQRTWFKGKILKVRGRGGETSRTQVSMPRLAGSPTRPDVQDNRDTTYDIKFDGGATEKAVPLSLIRSIEPKKIVSGKEGVV